MVTFADLLKKNKNNSDSNTEHKEEMEAPRISASRRYNRITVIDRQNSYETWEYNYFPYILELSQFFISNLVELYPDITEYLNSYEFLHEFSLFVYKNSSGYISPHLKKMNSTIEKIYNEYLQSKNGT